MRLRETLRKAAGLLVAIPPEAGTPSGAASADLDHLLAQLDDKTAQGNAPRPAKTVEQIVREAEGPNLDEIRVSAGTPPPVVTADGKVDFSAIYQQAALPATSFTAEQMLDMLASLPAGLPLETKRQTVTVTLGAMGKAIGASPETIVADTSRKLAALAAYGESVSQQTAEFVTRSELEIAALQAQIEEKRKAIQAAQEQHAQSSHMCEAESDRLDDVLEFFSLDLPPSRHAAPEETKS
jgi:hypothetical protein